MANLDPQERLSDACEELTLDVAQHRGMAEISLPLPRIVAELTDDELCSAEPGPSRATSKIEWPDFHEVHKIFTSAIEVHRLVLSPPDDPAILQQSLKELGLDGKRYYEVGPFQSRAVLKQFANLAGGSDDRSPTCLAFLYALDVFDRMCRLSDLVASRLRSTFEKGEVQQRIEGADPLEGSTDSGPSFASGDLDNLNYIEATAQEIQNSGAELFADLEMPDPVSTLERVRAEFTSMLAIQDAELSLKLDLMRLHCERFATTGLEPAELTAVNIDRETAGQPALPDPELVESHYHIDPRAYVSASELLKEGKPGCKTAYQLSRFLDDHPEIRQHKPHKNRRVVHLGDWHAYWKKEEELQSEAMDDEAMADRFAALAAQKEDERRQKKRHK